MDAATAYIPVAYGLPGNNFNIGYGDKPYFAPIPGVSPEFHNLQGYLVQPDTIFVGGFPLSVSNVHFSSFKGFYLMEETLFSIF